jgi:hypothetical protein
MNAFLDANRRSSHPYIAGNETELRLEKRVLMANVCTDAYLLKEIFFRDAELDLDDRFLRADNLPPNGCGDAGCDAPGAAGRANDTLRVMVQTRTVA